MNRSLRAAALATFALAGAARAQSDPRLVAAVRQAQEGQADSARASVRRLFTATPATDSLYPQILYTMALIAPDAPEREHDLRRIVVEHPISPWTDDALLLMAESDYGEGNLPATARDLERIRADFASSPVLPRAALWAARTYFDMRNQVAACRWITLGIIRAGKEHDLHDQLSVQARRCGALIAASDTLVRQEAPVTPAPPLAAAAEPVAVDTVRPPVTRDTTMTAPPAPKARTAGYRVQLAAAATQAEADGIVRSLRGQRIDADIVQEKGYYKVRTGHFATRRDAQAMAAQLKARVGGGPFVVAE